MFYPKVSIIIPVYNGANYVGEAIESALEQTYQNIEILVINDGSKDNGETEKKCLGYGNKINYIYKENGGVASAINIGINKMSGDFFSWLSHDDLYYPNKIEEQIKYISSINDKNIILFTNFEFIDSKGNKLFGSGINYIPSEKILYKALITFPINGCSLLIPKICFNNVGYFNESLKTIQDYEMWFRLLKKYKFVMINKVLVKNRRHDVQDSNKKTIVCIQGKSYLNKFVLNLFSIDEIKKSSGIKIPNILFKIYLLFRLNLLQLLTYTTILTRKLGIHTKLLPIARKIFFK